MPPTSSMVNLIKISMPSTSSMVNLVKTSMPSAPRLTDFELMLLLATLRVNDAYGVIIAREVERTTGRRVLMGAAYTALDRLEQRGLVSSRVGDPTPERGGRAKRYFHVTDHGLEAVRQTRRALENLWTGVPQLTEKRT